MKKLENIHGPNGWLVDPHNKWAIHFYSKKVSKDQIGTDYTIDMWGVVPNCKPMEFKSRRKASKTHSIKTWNQLVASNWVEVDLNKIKTA
tara:strand:- start:1094 stop:1363 length:270 start_codon:yes stop_codon:yes gene_type:complete